MSESKVSRKEQKARTREQLKSAALRCMSRDGVEGVQISQITQEAGVATGTFYVHFRDKDELLEELLTDFNEGLVTMLLEGWGQSKEDHLQAQVEVAVEIFLDYWAQNREFVEVYAQKLMMGSTLEAFREGVNPQASTLLSGLLRAKLQEDAEEWSIHLVTQGILSMWLRVGMQFLFRPEVSLELAQEVLKDMTWGALTAMYPSFAQS